MKNKILVQKHILIGYLLLLIFILPQYLSAQQFTMQLIIPSPGSPYFSDWESNPNIATLIVDNATGQSQNIIFSLNLTHSRYGQVLTVQSDPKTITPGQNIFNNTDFINWETVEYNHALERTIVQTGRLPEGTFTLCVDLQNFAGTSVFATTCASVDIMYPEPPRLVFPMNNDVITSEYPTFQWTPVVVPPDYQLRYILKIVEILPGQSPVQALRANIPHYENNNLMASYFTYSVEALPLEQGKTYAWQVQALDQNGLPPASNEGKSEIWTFSLGGRVTSEGFPQDSLELVDGVARLINLEDVSITETPFSYILNGQAEIKIMAGINIRKSAMLNSLEVQKFDLDRPVYVGGFLTSELRPDDIPDLFSGPFITFYSIQFEPGRGLTFQGEVSFPGIEGNYDLGSSIQLTSLGLSGTAHITGDPLFTIGDDLLQLKVNNLSVHFSEPTITIAGQFSLFDGDILCDVNDLLISEDGMSGMVSCSPGIDVSLGTAGSLLQLRVNTVDGNFGYSFLSRKIDYDLALTGNLHFASSEVGECSASLTARVSSETGFSVTEFSPSCSSEFSRVNLGWLNFAFNTLQIDSLIYKHGTGWDFSLNVNLDIDFPDLPGFTFPGFENVKITQAGLSIPALNFSSRSLPTIDFGGFGIKPLSIQLPAFTFQWSDWLSGNTTPWAFDISFKLTLPNLPIGTADCLIDPEITVEHASFSGGNFSASIPVRLFGEPGCSLPLGGGIILNVTELSGSLNAVSAGAGLNVTPNISIKGKFTLPSYFACTSGQQVDLGTTALSISGDGLITGTIENIIPPSCPLNLSIFDITIANSTLVFRIIDGNQSIVLNGSGSLSLPAPGGGTVSARGTIVIDLIQGKMIDGRFAINEQFVLEIPTDEPVLSFRINRAVLDTSGLEIDGRNRLLISEGAEIGCTFDHLLINPTNLSIISGKVLFDFPFAFKVGIGDGSLNWAVVRRNELLPEPTGIILNLPDTLLINSSGLQAHGNASIHLKYDGRDLDSLLANFSSDFGFSLSPFRVESGQVEFFYEGQRVAVINRTGFFPDPLFFGRPLLPAKLGLPDTTIAYLKLKEGERFLINTEIEPDGDIRISTIPGQPIALVFPILKFDLPISPQLNVEFNLTIDPMGLSVKGGSFTTSIPEEQLDNFDLTRIGIPFQIQNLDYNKISDLYAFTLGGKLKLFNEELGGDAISLTFTPDSRITGDISISVNDSLPMIPGSDRLMLKIGNVNGSFNSVILGPSIDFELNIDGGLIIHTSESSSRSIDASLRITKTGLEVLSVTTDPLMTSFSLPLGAVTLNVSNLGISELTYSGSTGWDFDFNMDLGFSFPELGNINLPSFAGTHLRPSGFTIPDISIPEIDREPFTFSGVSLKPLAFRMDGITFNWFTWNGTDISDWGFSFDFQIDLPELPSSFPAGLRNPRLTVLNAGYRNGRITGSIEPRPIDPPLTISLAEDFGLNVRHLAGVLKDTLGSQHIEVTLKANLTPPPFMRCAESDTLGLLNTELTLSTDGHIKGAINPIIPHCPLMLGPIRLDIVTSDLRFDYINGEQNAKLALQGNVRLPSPTPGDTISAGGHLVVDLIHAKIDSGEIGITEPFVFGIPRDEQILRFQINAATLNKEGLQIDGSSQLLLSEGATVGVTFNNLLVGIPDFDIVSGSVDFTRSFAFRVGLGDGGHLDWGAVALDASTGISDGFVLNLPPTIGINADGFRASGEASASIRLNDSTYESLSANFSSTFMLQFSPFKVAHGRVDFFIGETNVAHLDSTGFWPGDFFGILPIPARLPLPNESIAYIQLKDNDNNLLIHSEMTGGNLRLYTRRRDRIQLVVPALAYGTPDTPRVNIQFDVTVNPTTFDFVSGSIDVRPPPGTDTLFSLVSRGIPLVINSLKYADIGASYGLIASASFALPKAIAKGSLTLDSLMISEHGISGRVSLGQYSDTYNKDITPVKSFDIGDAMTFTVDGATADFTGSSFQINFSGNFLVNLFAAEDGAPEPIHYAAELGTDSIDFSIDLSHLTDAPLPLYLANFKPDIIGGAPPIAISVSNSEFTATINGILSMPSLSPEFAVTIRDFKVGTGGIDIPDVSITLPRDIMSFELFGAEFALIDTTIGTTTHKAIDFEEEGNVLHLITTGRITIFDHTIRYYGLNIGTDGSVSIDRVDFLDESIWLVDDVLSIDTLSIVRNNLQVRGGITLPEPFDTTGRQGFSFDIGTDGSIAGGAQINIINETPGLGRGDRSEFGIWLATFDLTYLGLNLNIGDLRASSVKMVADAYWDNNINKRVEIGEKSGTIVTSPGLEIKFNGDVSWGNVSLPSTFDFNFEALSCSLDEINLPEGDGFGLEFSGSLSINLGGVSGGIDYTQFKIGTDGFHWGSITGVNLRIIDVVTIEVDSIGYSTTPTTINVRGGDIGSGSGSPSSDSTEISVDSYFSFGAAITIAGIGNGGIDQFLTYRKDDSNNLIIRNAHLEIESILKLGIDLKYHSQGNNFSLLIGGRGELLESYGVTVVGEVAQVSGNTSFGVFVAAGVTIPIGPGIIISELGGGFFYNPTNEALNLVRARCNLEEDIAESVNAEPAHFAFLLYGGVAVINEGIARGRVLLTFTDRYFSLDAGVVVLNQGDCFYGKMHLEIGLSKAYAEGNIELNVEMASVITGNASLEFYVYDSNAWGIMGGIDVKIVNFLEASASLFVGPPGFMVDCEIKHGFDIWIISMEAGFNGLVWYKVDVSWGAYMKIWIEADVLAGIAGAKGWMEAALVHKSGFILYGLAGLRVHVLFVSWEGSVWAKFDNGDVDAGFGRDSEMDRLIDEARSMGEEMEEAKDQALDAMENASKWTPIDVSLSEEELAEIYLKMRAMNRYLLDEIAWPAAYREQDYARTAYDAIRTGDAIHIWQGRGAPDSSGVRSARLQVDVTSNRIDRKRGNVVSLLDNIQAEITSLPPAEEYTLGGNPTRTSGFGESLSTTIKINPGGDTVKVVRSQPSFVVNDEINSQNQLTLSSAEEKFQQIEQQIIESILLLEDARTSVYSALVGDESGGISDFAEDYTEAQERVEYFYAEQNDYLRGTSQWAKEKLGYWNTLRTSYEDWLNRKCLILETGNKWAEMLYCTDQRIQTITTIYDSIPSAYQNWEDEKTDRWPNPESARKGVTNDFDFDGLKEAYIQTGMDLWYNVAHAGLSAVSERSDSLILALGENFDRHRTTFSIAHQALTSSVDALWEGYTDISEQLYDLYDRYIYWKYGESSPLKMGEGVVSLPGNISRQVISLRPAAPSIFQKRNQLLEELEVPQITSLNATASIVGMHNKISLNWSARHPKGITEYAYGIRSGVGSSLSSWGLQSAGMRTYMFSYDIPRRLNPEGEVHRFNMTLRARGGAGYTARRMINYETRFSPITTPDGRTSSTWTSTMASDGTPPINPSVSFPDYGTEYEAVGIVALRPRAAYSSNPGEIHATWSGYDTQSDIVEYQYSVGTAPGNTSLLGWKTSAGMTDRIIRGLHLEESQLVYRRIGEPPMKTPVYYVNVKAKNGAGLWSNAGSSIPLYIDTTPPSFPSGSEITIMQLPPLPEDMPVVDYSIRPCCSQLSGTMPISSGVSAGAWSGNLQSGITGAREVARTGYTGTVQALLQLLAPPHVKVKFPIANDFISPIKDYYYKVVTDNNFDWSPETWSRIADLALGSPGRYEFEIDGIPPLPMYYDTIYIAIRATNLAGLVSEPIISDPFYLRDQTPPKQPEFCVAVGESPRSELRITINTPASDPESGIKGYQFGVGNARTPGVWDVHNLPSLLKEPVIDFTPDQIRRGNTLTISGLNLVHGESYYFCLRAINNENLASATTSGPVQVMFLLPPQPVVTPRYEKPKSTSGNLILDITISRSVINEISRTEISVGSKPGHSDVMSWQAIAGAETGTFRKSTSITLAVGKTYYISARTVNNAGLMSNIFKTSLYVP